MTEGQLHESCIRIMSQWYSNTHRPLCVNLLLCAHFALLFCRYKIPLDKRYPCGGGACLHHNVSTPAHKALARKISAMSTVLLKNDGHLLPLDGNNKKLKIVLIGTDANNSYTAGQGAGGGSNSNVAVSPLAAMQTMAKTHGFSVMYDAGLTAASAAKAAAVADVAIVFGSAHSGEGHDRTDLLFNNETGTERLENVITEVAKVQQKTVVVAAVPGQILTDWRDDVAAILIPFLPGEQYGNAIADIVFGVIPPQAKLPLSFPNKSDASLLLQLHHRHELAS